LRPARSQGSACVIPRRRGRGAVGRAVRRLLRLRQPALRPRQRARRHSTERPAELHGAVERLLTTGPRPLPLVSFRLVTESRSNQQGGGEAGRIWGSVKPKVSTLRAGVEVSIRSLLEQIFLVRFSNKKCVLAPPRPPAFLFFVLIRACGTAEYFPGSSKVC